MIKLFRSRGAESRTPFLLVLMLCLSPTNTKSIPDFLDLAFAKEFEELHLILVLCGDTISFLD